MTCKDGDGGKQTAHAATLSKRSTHVITEAKGMRELRKLRHVLDGYTTNAGPVETDQLPVMPRLQLNGDVGVVMGLTPASTVGVRLARNAILLSLQAARATGHEGIHYSRDRNEYSRLRHNMPDYWTYSNVRDAVDSFQTRPDLVCENRARPQNPDAPAFSRRRSVLFSGPAFVDTAVLATDEIVETVGQSQRIILRDRRKKLLPVPPGPIVEETMRFQALFDGAVAKLRFGFADPTIHWLSSTMAVGICDGWRVPINTERRFLTRIHTAIMLDGGRFYRVFWQEVPKALRRVLLINDAPTAEHDYSACHLQLAYFAVGAMLPTLGEGERDHYTLDGFGEEWRTVIKKGVSILLNARSYAGAVGAIASVEEMPEGPWAQRVEVAVSLVAGIAKRHEALNPLWHTGCGLGLQYVDSQLTMLCATELIGRGIVPLPIHDSMLVPVKDLGALVEVMDRRFNEDGPRLAATRFADINKQRRGFRGHDLTQGRNAGEKQAVPTASADRAAPFATEFTLAEGVYGALLATPIFTELQAIICHLGWLPGGVVRGALLSANTYLGDRAQAAQAVRSWIDDLIARNRIRFDTDRVEAEYGRFLSRKARPIAPHSLARLSGVSHRMSRELDLVLIVPEKRVSAPSRPAKRLLTTLPRIVSIKDATPFLGRARSAWFAEQNDPARRQIEALRVILQSGDQTLIDRARSSVMRHTNVRASLPATPQLPVDDFLHEASAMLLMHDLFPPCRLVDHDVSIRFADRQEFWKCKPSPQLASHAAVLEVARRYGFEHVTLFRDGIWTFQ